MKTLLAILISGSMLFTSCVVVTPSTQKSSGKKKGWYKNPNNPHHPKSTNPGHNKKHWVMSQVSL